MFKFKVSYVALAAALSSSVVYADPSSYTHRSGANVIDIEAPKEGANKQVISSQADSLIKISRIWADFFPANTSNQPI